MTQPDPIQPLAGMRVLDFSRLLPGPYASMLLADLGAEVIKIETPRLGDYARDAPPEFGGSGMFHLLNRGKKSLALNYRNQRGRAIFLELVKTADVVLESFKPGSMDKWGFGYEALRAIRPGLVYCSLSGYGQAGPYQDRAGHDVNYVAVGGLAGLNGAPGGGAPHTNGVQVADLGGGMMATLSILAALLNRQRTGQGAYLDVAMLDVVVSWALPVAGAWFFGGGGSPQPGQLPLSGGWPCYNLYAAQDGLYLSLGAIEDPFWGAFCKLTARPDLLDKRFDPAYIPVVAAVFKTKPRQAWLDLFAGEDACIEPVNTIEEALRHPQVAHRGLVQMPPPAGGQAPTTRSPIPLGAVTPAGTGPALGEHTRAVLLNAGFAAAELDDLEKSGVIRDALSSAG